MEISCEVSLNMVPKFQRCCVFFRKDVLYSKMWSWPFCCCCSIL